MSMNVQSLTEILTDLKAMQLIAKKVRLKLLDENMTTRVLIMNALHSDIDRISHLITMDVFGNVDEYEKNVKNNQP